MFEEVAKCLRRLVRRVRRRVLLGCRQIDGSARLGPDCFSCGLMSDSAARNLRLKIEFIAFGLLMLSDAMSEVSIVPGG